jgi:radical SAM protein with 4Fe4S-binding SPASM domain
MIQFIGGEPSNHPRLSEMILRAKEEGFDYIEVFTNGTLLNNKDLGLFRDQGVRVAISLYSYRPEIHDGITNVPGSWRATMETLNNLRKYRIPVRVGVIVMRQNEADAEKTKRFLLQNKLADSVRLDGIRPSGRGADERLSPASYDPVRRQPGFRANWREYIKNRQQNSCWHGKLAITSDGNIIPCIFARNEVLGNIRDLSLREIINSPRTQELWHILHDQVDVCMDCEYRYVCRDCRALPLNVGRGILGQSPRCAYNPYKGEWDLGPSVSLSAALAASSVNPEQPKDTRLLSEMMRKF